MSKQVFSITDKESLILLIDVFTNSKINGISGENDFALFACLLYFLTDSTITPYCTRFAILFVNLSIHEEFLYTTYMPPIAKTLGILFQRVAGEQVHGLIFFLSTLPLQRDTPVLGLTVFFFSLALKPSFSKPLTSSFC